MRAARIGDASCFLLQEGAGFNEVFAAPEGALNEVAVSLPGATEADVEVAEVPAPHGTVVVATDGVALDLRMSPGVRTWLARSWAEPIGPFAMADSLRYERRGSLDDRTAAVIWPAARPTSAKMAQIDPPDPALTGTTRVDGDGALPQLQGPDQPTSEEESRG